MTSLFNFQRFLELGFISSSHKDSWNREITEYTYARNGTEFKLSNRENSEIVMGVCSTKSGKWENHAVDEEEALRWFQRTFPDIAIQSNKRY